MSNQSEVSQIVMMIGAAYPNFAPTKETVGVYCELLKDLPFDLLKNAALQCCAESGRKFAPSVGEIRGAVSEIRRQMEGVPTGLQAWGELLTAPKSEETRRITDEKDEEGRILIEVTPYQWSHPLVRKVAVMMGFPRFPDWDAESFERTAFLKAYEKELQSYLRVSEQLPEVNRFIEANQVSLGAEQEIKQLAEGMTK